MNAPAHRLPRVAVFCGASVGTDPAYARAARELGAALGSRGWGLVYGGGNVGLMGAIADATIAAGGEVIGVIPEALRDRELAHDGCRELIVVDTMHERKRAMMAASDAFVAMPGGIGTLEELTEVFAWLQLGFHGKPCAMFDVAGYWAPFRALLDHVCAEGFMRREAADQLLWADAAEALLERLSDWHAPTSTRWSASA